MHRIAASPALARAIRFGIGSFCIGLGLSPAGAQGTPATTATTNGVSATIGRYARAHDFSGSVTIEQHGRTIYQGNFGLADRAFGVPVARDTRFHVASITKLFTAVLVLQLVDEGAVDVDAPVERYLPDYPRDIGGRVTVRQLLTHTSGLAQYDRITSYEEALAKGMEVYQLPHAPAELLARYASGPLVHEPGSTFDYNNADYVVLGHIVERVTGVSFEAALAQRILRPLALTGTGMLHAQSMVARLARTYMRADSAAPLLRDLPVYPENWWAAGGMYSTADDLLAFARALYGGRLLRPASLAALLTPGKDDYGYGLWVSSQKIGATRHRFAQRPGRIMGANVTLLRYLDDGLTIVILGNTNVADIDRFGFLTACAALRRVRDVRCD